MANNPIHQALSDAVDEGLLEVIKGRLVRDADGNVMLDPDGKPLRERPSAADFNAAINRLKSLGITKQVTQGSPVAQIMEQMRAANVRFPGKLAPVDTDGDDDATQEDAA